MPRSMAPTCPRIPSLMSVIPAAPKAGGIDLLPFGLAACRPALKTMINYALRQKMIPRPLEVEELFDDYPRAGQLRPGCLRRASSDFNHNGMMWWQARAGSTKNSLTMGQALHAGHVRNFFMSRSSPVLPARNAFPVSWRWG